jgi:hypothetical protein
LVDIVFVSVDVVEIVLVKMVAVDSRSRGMKVRRAEAGSDRQGFQSVEGCALASNWYYFVSRNLEILRNIV